MTDQVLEVLREGMLSGRWRGTLPGRDRLAKELGVSHRTVEQAMRRLAKEGLLASQGPGRRRRIVLPEGEIQPRHFRLRVLAYDPSDRALPFFGELLGQLKARGFTADFTTKTLLDLGMDVKRVARFVHKVPADAWIVTAGSRQVLEWFCTQPVPAYALFGVKSGVPIAGCGIRKNLQPVIRRLVGLGHRRIVLLSRENMIVPEPALFQRKFLETLQAEGIRPTSYHLPVWGYRPAGLHRCLESLFQVTPPTALIVEEIPTFLAVRDHLARRGIIAPRDVSLICLDHDPSFSWCDPLPTHFNAESAPLTRRIARWAGNVARGVEDRRQTFTHARFIEGGTIGPAPKRR